MKQDENNIVTTVLEASSDDALTTTYEYAEEEDILGEAVEDHNGKARKRNQYEVFIGWIKRKMEFRYNQVMNRIEYKEKGKGQKEWARPHDLHWNTWAQNFNHLGYSWSAGKTRANVATLNVLKIIHPIRAYFQHTVFSDTRDYISELADTITVAPLNGKPDTATQTLWRKWLKKWMMAAVANVFIEDKNCNHTMIILIGKQGIYKTTWLRECLCPPALIKYFDQTAINPKEKDHRIKLSRYFMINLDDSLPDFLSPNNINSTKDFMTLPFVQERLPYGHEDTKLYVIANLTGTSNDKKILPTGEGNVGNRRFIPIEVGDINWPAARNMIDAGLTEKAWQQAYMLWKNNERYWFNTEEKEELAIHNLKFTAATPEEELLLFYYDIPKSKTEANKFLPVSKIAGDLRRKSGIERINRNRVGEALRSYNFPAGQERVGKTPTRGFYVIERGASDLDAHQKAGNAILREKAAAEARQLSLQDREG